MAVMRILTDAYIVLLVMNSSPGIFQVEKGQTLRVEVSLVTVGISVMDPRGLAVPNLQAGDFRLFEDRVAQQIAFFANVEQPTSLGILLDRSDSMGPAYKLEKAKDAALRIVETSHGESEFFYMPFDGQFKVPSEFSKSRDQLKQAVAATALGEGTRLYDAVLGALELFRRADYGRKAIILITDGTDQHSRHTLDEMIGALQESQVQFFAIGYFSSKEDDIFRNSGPKISMENYQLIDNPRLVFKRLADESGAEAFFPRSDQELKASIEKILRDLQTQYTLAYYPSDPTPGSRYRRISVKLKP
ncbi:MAG TPA: VWA domain-containing protein, partial [Acidobacteriota bacterium]|nr:VWA domain-containing protein [Acidobacteriota bacterium]